MKSLPEQSTSPSDGGVLVPENKTLSKKEYMDRFWYAGEALDSFTVRPAAPEVDYAILKRLGDTPFSINGKNITTLLFKAYKAASIAALQKTSGESED